MKRFFSFIIIICLLNNLQAQNRDALNISSFSGYPLTIGDNNNASTKIAFNKVLPMDVELDSMPRFQIGAIPNQTIWHKGDVTIGFYVLTDTLQASNVTLSYTIDFEPEGKITFNAQTGRFKYFPEKTDVRNFIVTFRAAAGNRVITQEVLFSLMPATPPEYAAFGVEPIKPLPSSNDDYTIISATKRDNVHFNNQPRTVYSYSISGKELVFDNNIQNKLHGLSGEDIDTLNIFAEKVIIRDALHFKQTNVTIYAKELIFEDKPNQAPASLNTSPVMFSTYATTNNGERGENAGNITLYIKEYKQSNPHKRFILIGGKGQGASRTTQQDTRTAGNGGNGGTLTSTIDVSDFCDLIHGSSGIQIHIIGTDTTIVGAGQHGQDGSFVLNNEEFSWLHPNFISAVVKHAKDAYLNIHNGFTYNIFSEYTEQIASYKESEEWEDLNDEAKMELTNAENEMQAIIARISQNLDYFGNPIGWVPMLSFEVNKDIFETEVDRAIRVMYLSYWLKNIDASNAEYINARNQAIEWVKDDLRYNQTLVNDLVLLIPELQDEAAFLQQKIDNLIVRIEQKTQQLLSKAQSNVKKRNRWNKICGVLSIVAKVAPVIDFVLPGVGTAISSVATIGGNVLSQATNSSDTYGYGNAVGGFMDVAGGFLNSGGFANITGALNQIDISSLNTTYNTIQNAYSTINSTVSPLVKGIENLHRVFAKSSTPNNQVQAELDRLKAESREYHALIAEAEVLNAQKVELMSKLANTFDNIAKVSVSIQNNILTIDGLHRGVFNANSKRDLRAMQYLDDMERRAKERLLKYHYYMAKAYEYRMLKPYPNDINTMAMFERLKNIAEANPNQPVLNEHNFDILKVLYEEQISTITSDILEMYNTNRPELSVPVYFALTQEDKDALNSGASINLNIFERGMIPPTQENVRIVKFEIQEITAHLEGNNTSFAYFDLLLEHSGISKLRKDGEIFYFNHINNQNQNPITWGIRYDAYGGFVNNHEPSFASQSLLYSLLGNLANDNIMIYSRPSAWSDIRITKNDVASGNTRIIIDNIVFKLQYDFTQRPANNRNLDVYAADIENSNISLSPYMEISRADRSGRSDGRGTLYRTYGTNAAVNLEAPQEYGRYRFVNWVNRYDEVVSTQKQVSVTMSNDTWLKANYQYMGPVLAMADSVLVGKNAGEVDVLIENIGFEEMDWSAISNNPWLSIISADEGIDAEYLVLQFEENPLSTKRVGSITVTAPETAEYQKILRVIQSNETESSISTTTDNAKQPTIFSKDENIFGVILPQSANRISVDVFAANGQLVFRSYYYNTSVFDVNLSHCSQGVYIAKIVCDGNVYTQKIVK